ncbi:MAG: aldo/keto reductase [Halobacteriaceae archaeon]
MGPDETAADAATGVGLGTARNTDPEQCAESVRAALEAGYRHVDTAQDYDNEAYVGDGVERADVPREEVFLATKVATANLGGEDVVESVRGSLDRLGVEYVDLLYVHWPIGEYEATDTLPAFDRLREEGLVRHVGLSNFTLDLLDEAREVLDAPVFAHQVELHPFLPQGELRGYAAEHGHRLVAYSPLAKGRVLDDPTIREVADRRDATPAQVTLAWHLAKGVVPIPKATGEAHVRENLAAADVELTEADVAAIDDIEAEERVIDFDEAPWNG